MMKDNDKIKIDLINQAETEERNGVEVRIENVDTSEYIDALSHLYYIPNLYLNSNCYSWASFKDFNTRKIYKYKSFYSGYRDFSFTSGFKVLSGNILYPVDITKIEKDFPKESISRIESINPKFEIGELDVTPNREELMYTQKTIEALRKKYQEVLSELSDYITADYNRDFDDIFDYYATFNKDNIVLGLQEGDNIVLTGNYFMSQRDITYKGKHCNTMSYVFDVIHDCLYHSIKFIYHWDGTFHSYTKSTYYNAAKMFALTKYMDRKNPTVLVLPDSKGTKSTYFRDYVQSVYTDRNTYYVENPNIPCTKDELLAYMKNEGVVNRFVQDKEYFDTALWAFIQVLKSLKKRCTFVDIVNSKEYTEYKAKLTKEARALTKANDSHIKTTTFYFHYCDEYSYGGPYFVRDNFTDIKEVIKNRRLKNKTVYITTEDNGDAIDLLFGMYKHNTNIVVLAVAKGNAKVLKQLPDNFKNINEVLNWNNNAFRDYISQQYFARKNFTETDKIIHEVMALSSYLTKEDSKAINDCYQNKNYEYSHSGKVSAVVDKVGEANLNQHYSRCFSIVTKYHGIIEKMTNITKLANGINPLFAYFGMKNKLFRLNYQTYLNIKTNLTVKA